MNMEQTARLLSTRDNILLLTHRNPDGDTIGSACALCSALRRMGKTAWLYDNRGISGKYSAYIKGFIAGPDFKPDYTAAVDAATERMLPDGFDGRVDLCIDHHPTNSRYADELLLDENAAAVGEIMFGLIHELTGSVTQSEATLLYLAVSTDTGRYLHSNTNAETFMLSARLYECGADMQRINTEFFKKASMARIKLEGMMYSSMSFYFDGLCCVARVTDEMLKKSGAGPEDLEDLANLPARAEGCRIAVLLKQQGDIIKVSVRTDGYSAIDICSRFGGGGHAAASGCSIALPMDEAEQAIVNVIKELIG